MNLSEYKWLYFFVSAFFALLSMSGFTQGKDYITEIDQNFNTIDVVNWLSAGPFPSVYYSGNEKHESLRNGYAIDFLQEVGGETGAQIQHGTNLYLPSGKVLEFKPANWDRAYLDLTYLYGDKAPACAYLYSEIKCKKKQEVFFHVGINDAGKVWLNGKQIISHPLDGPAEKSDEIVKVDLKEGVNQLLVKIDQAGGEWGAYFQIYSRNAQEQYLNSLVDYGKSLSDQNSVATLVSHHILCKEENRYIGWPTICKTREGELLVVFSGDRDQHICPFGITQMVRSIDNGETWSDPETINNTPLDDRDAGIIQIKDGTLVVSWFTSLAFDRESYFINNPSWKRHAAKLGPETRERWLGNWIRRSTDNGRTWEEPVRQNGTAPHGPIELNDGRLLYVGTGKLKGEKVNSVEESKDGGKSWQLIATIPIPDDEDIGHYHEPHVAELPDGKLVAQIRYQPETKRLSFLRQSESYDGGQTWTVTHETPLWGYPPHLIVLDNRWLLSVYGVRRKPYSERACISKDGGLTWDIENEIILKDAMNGDLGYPASVQLDDGSIFTVYYQIDKAGEKTCLMGTKWRLKE